MNAKDLKSRLFESCEKQVDTRYSKIKKIISGIEEALFEETKSSSGDKHETGRAMLQIERENAGRQLQEIEKLAAILDRIDIKSVSDNVRLGSLVYTDKNIYFISLSIGAVTLEGILYLCVAINSPVGSLLLGKKKGDSFNLNGTVQTIMDVQ